MDLVSLPCSRRRHGDCAGEFAHGVARWEMRDGCTCSCHVDLETELLDPRYGVWGRAGRRLTLVAEV